MLKNIFSRAKNNPIILPDKKLPWQSIKTYNAGAILVKDKVQLFFRAIGNDWVSSIGRAYSFEGSKFLVAKKPILTPSEKVDRAGVEDPRIVFLENKYWLTYTSFDGQTARLSLATSSDLRTWVKQGPMLRNWDYFRAGGFVVPWDELGCKNNWSKAGGIFSEKINGKYLMIFGDTNLWLAESMNGHDWKAVDEPFIKPRKNKFDSVHVEMGPPPIKTKKGWLVLYHGIDNHITYRLGYILLDLQNPKKIIKRSVLPIFEPQEKYELSGIVDILPGGLERMKKLSKAKLQDFLALERKTKKMPQVVFCCGAVLQNGNLHIYYGAGDSVVCTAKAKLAGILGR